MEVGARVSIELEGEALCGVVQSSDDGEVTVLPDEGCVPDDEPVVAPLSSVRLVPALTADEIAATTRVVARFSNGAFYPGIITARRDDATFDITFEDGDTRSAVPLADICALPVRDIAAPNDRRPRIELIPISRMNISMTTSTRPSARRRRATSC